MPGHVIVMWSDRYLYSLALILQVTTKRNNESTYTVLTLCNHGDDAAILLVNSKPDHVMPYRPLKELFQPETTVAHAVIEVTQDMIIGLTKKDITVDYKRVISDYKQRQMPRFK